MGERREARCWLRRQMRSVIRGIVAVPERVMGSVDRNILGCNCDMGEDVDANRMRGVRAQFDVAGNTCFAEITIVSGKLASTCGCSDKPT
jgi:hypothetical protein